MEHCFGKPDEFGLGVDERYCNEPVIPKATYTRVYHAHFTMLPGGNIQCNHCGEYFIPVEDNA